MKPTLTREKIAGHWIGKTTAGALCGFALSIASSGLLVRLAPGSSANASKAEVAMLAVPLVWIAVFSLAYLFRSGLRAWLWLGSISAAAFAVLEACR
ncbi:MAG: hypothetical protein WDN30_11135 [Pararobbsia sp.]